MKKSILLALGFVFFMQSSVFASTAVNYNAYRAYLKGVLALKAGKIEDARKEYERVISLDPQALIVYKDLIYLYWQAGNKDKAFKIAERIEELDGNNAQTAIFLGTFYLVANEPANAKKYWEKTLELDPENETATVYLAAYYYSDNKLSESAEYWNKFLDQQPDSAAGYLQLAMVQEKLGKFEDALASYDKVISLKPEAMEAYLSKARIYEANKQYDLAIAEYEDYMKVFPDNMYVLMYLGKSYFEAGNVEKARDIFIKAKKGLPGDVTPNYWLGIVYERMGQIDKSAAEFEKVYEKEKSVAILARLGYYYSILKDYAKAEKRFKSALEQEPYNHELLYLTALNYMDWEKYDKSIQYLIKTVEQKPDLIDAYFFLGSAYEKSKDYDNAEKMFLRTLEMNPDHTRALNYLGYMYADRNIKLREAEQYLIRAINLEPQNGAFQDSLGWLYYRQGNYEAAANLLLSAANLTRDPLVYDHLGDAYVELGRIGEAWIAYALSFDIKSDKNVKKKLDMVQAKIPKEDLHKQMLLRSESNFLKLFSFKAGFVSKISSGVFSIKTYIPFNYVKNEGVSIEIPGRFVMGGAMVYIENGQVSYVPQAVKEYIPAEMTGLMDFAALIFNRDFYRQFDNAKTVQKGKKIIYSTDDGSELVLNLETALIEKISKNDMVVELSAYKKFIASRLPSKIKANSKKLKLKGTFETNNFNFSDRMHLRDIKPLQEEIPLDIEYEIDDTDPGED